MYNFSLGKKTISLALKAEQKNYLLGIALAARFFAAPYEISESSAEERKSEIATVSKQVSTIPTSTTQTGTTQTGGLASRAVELKSGAILTSAGGLPQSSSSRSTSMTPDFSAVVEIPADDLGYSRGTRFTLVSSTKQRTYMTMDNLIWQGCIEFAKLFLKRPPLSFVTDIIDFGKNGMQILPDIVADANVKVYDNDSANNYNLRYTQKTQLAQIFTGDRSLVSAPYVELRRMTDFLDAEREYMTDQMINFLSKALLTRLLELPSTLIAVSDDSGITLTTEDLSVKKRIGNDALNDNFDASYIQQLLSGYLDEFN